MLRELSIQDFVIVRDLNLSLNTGLTVLTGETGAGKSILIDALGLVLGQRVAASVVRAGAKRAQITAIFDATPAAQSWLAGYDLDGDDEIVLRRVVDAQGKGRAYINGAPTTINQLKELGELLVDIHGQHAHQGLLRPESQRDLLDEFAALMKCRDEIAVIWHNWQEASRQLERAQQDQQVIQTRQQDLEWKIEELEKLDPKKDEWLGISEEHARLSNGQALLEGAQAALQSLDDDESGAQRTLDMALHSITPLLKHDSRLQGVAQALESACISVREARSDISRYLDAIDLDPDRLASVEHRMRALFDTARKYHCDPEELTSLRSRLKDELEALVDAQDIEALQARLNEQKAAYDELAASMHERRVKSATELAESVTRMIRLLGMPDGLFAIDIEPCPPGPSGADRITLKVAGHEGAALAPLNKVASGGELSRITLALSVLASQANRVPTLIFDEIDTGVSGAVAEKIGELLRQLGQSFQVLCVTHLAQVASCANHHCTVSKEKDEQGVYSNVQALTDLQSRTEAIAKLLGGVQLTETTRKHAREMLERIHSA